MELWGRSIRRSQIPPNLLRQLELGVITITSVEGEWLQDRLKECRNLDLLGIPFKDQKPYLFLPDYED